MQPELPSHIEIVPIERDWRRARINNDLVERLLKWKRDNDIYEERIVGDYLIRIFHGLNVLNAKFDQSVRLRLRNYNFDEAFSAPEGYELIGHEMGEVPVLDISKIPAFVGVRGAIGFTEEVHFSVFRRVNKDAPVYTPRSSAGGKAPYEDPQIKSILDAERERLKVLNKRIYDLPNGNAWGHCFSVTVRDHKALPAFIAAESTVEHFKHFLSKGYTLLGTGEAAYVETEIGGLGRTAVYKFGLTFWRRDDGPKESPDFRIDDEYLAGHQAMLKKISPTYEPLYPKQGMRDSKGDGVIWETQISEYSGIPIPLASQEEDIQNFERSLVLENEPPRISFPALCARGYEAMARKLWRIYRETGVAPDVWHFQLRFDYVDLRRNDGRSRHRLFEIDVGVRNAFGSELHDIREEKIPAHWSNNSWVFQEAQHEMHEGKQSPAESASTRRVFIEVRPPIRMEDSAIESGISMFNVQEVRVARIVQVLERFPDCTPVTFRYQGSFRVPVPIPGITKLPVYRDEVSLDLAKPGAGKINYGFTGNPITPYAKELVNKSYEFPVFLDSQGLDGGDLTMIKVSRDDKGRLNMILFMPKSEIYKQVRDAEIKHKKAIQEIQAQMRLNLHRINGQLRALLVYEILAGNDDDVSTGEGMRKLLGTTRILESEFDNILERILGPMIPVRLRKPNREWDDLSKLGVASYDGRSKAPEQSNAELLTGDQMGSNFTPADGKYLGIGGELYWLLDEDYLVARYGPNYMSILSNLPEGTFDIPQSMFYMKHRSED